MSGNEVFLLAVRWLHALAAMAWVGGSLFYLLVLRPALRKGGQAASPFNTLAAQEFRGLVDICIIVLVLTGAILTFDRLTSRFAGVPYVAALGFKVALSLGMFYLARFRRPRPWPLPLETNPAPPPSVATLRRVARAVTGANLILILGIVVFLLSDLLKVLFEQALLRR